MDDDAEHGDATALLLTLPEDVQEQIIFVLHPFDLESAFQTCRRLRDLIRSGMNRPELVAKYYRRFFGYCWREGTRADVVLAMRELRESTVVECLREDVSEGRDVWLHATNGRYCILQEYPSDMTETHNYVLHAMSDDPAARRRIRSFAGGDYCDLTWFTGVKGQEDVVWYLTKPPDAGGLGPVQAECYGFESGAALAAFQVYLPGDPRAGGPPLLLLDYDREALVVAVQCDTLLVFAKRLGFPLPPRPHEPEAPPARPGPAAVVLPSPKEARRRAPDGSGERVAAFPPACPSGAAQGGWYRLSGAALLPNGEEIRCADFIPELSRVAIFTSRLRLLLYEADFSDRAFATGGAGDGLLAVRLIRERVFDESEIPYGVLHGEEGEEGPADRLFFSSGAHYFALIGTDNPTVRPPGEPVSMLDYGTRRDVHLGFFAWRDGRELRFEFPPEHAGRALHFSENGNRALVLDLARHSLLDFSLRTDLPAARIASRFNARYDIRPALALVLPPASDPEPFPYDLQPGDEEHFHLEIWSEPDLVHLFVDSSFSDVAEHNTRQVFRLRLRRPAPFEP